MFPLNGLHSLAAQRGDGLRQEFLELLAGMQSRFSGNVEDIVPHRAEHYRQAGPNRVGRMGDTQPANVLLFPAPATAPRPAPRQEPARGRTI